MPLNPLTAARSEPLSPQTMGSASSAMAPYEPHTHTHTNTHPHAQAPMLLRHSIDYVDAIEAKEAENTHTHAHTAAGERKGSERGVGLDSVHVEYRDWLCVASGWQASVGEIKSRLSPSPSLSPSVSVDAALDVLAWEFDIWNLSQEQLVNLGLFVFHRAFGSSAAVQMDIAAMYRLLVEVRFYMTRHHNPYHNFTHVLDVLQSCATMLFSFNAQQWFVNKDLEMFALLLGGLMHDLDHPGLNNVYHANAVTPLAIRYNDTSILENYHCALAFEILHSTNFNVVPSMTVADKKTIRKLMISLILATDMSVHFALQAEVLSAVEKIKQGALVPAECPEKERTLLLKSILHSADISNPAKPWRVSKAWSDLVLEEFFLQGDREKKEGLPVSMNCDRDTTHQDELSLNFADFIIVPYAWAQAGWIPEYAHACRIVAENRRIWHGMLTERLRKTITDEAKLKETLDKWQVRADACEEKLKTLPSGSGK